MLERVGDIAAFAPHWPHGDCMVVADDAPTATTMHSTGSDSGSDSGSGSGSDLRLVGSLRHSDSPIRLDILSTAPCCQLYFSTLLEGVEGRGRARCGAEEKTGGGGEREREREGGREGGGGWMDGWRDGGVEEDSAKGSELPRIALYD